MKIVSKSWIYNNLKTSLHNNSSVNSLVKSIIEDVKKNGDKAILKYVRTVSYTHLRAHETR